MTIPSTNSSKPKAKFSRLNKWAGIICSIIAIFFLFIGVSELVAGPSKIEAVKPDFSNLSSKNPVTVKLDNVANIGIELVSSSRRSSTTYYYFLANVQNRKIIIESTSKNDIKTDATINIKEGVSSKATENLTNIKTLASQTISDPTLKLSSDEVSKVRVVKHYTESDKFLGDYWGWVAFAIFAIAGIANFIRYNRNKQIAELEHTTESANDIESTSATKSVSSEWGIDSNHFLKNKALNQTTSHSKPNINRVKYALLAIFLGFLGVHQFYKGKIWMGVLHISWLPLFIIYLSNPDSLYLLLFLAMLIFPISFITSIIQAILSIFKQN